MIGVGHHSSLLWVLAALWVVAGAGARAGDYGNLDAMEYGDPLYRENGINTYEELGHAGLYYGIDATETNRIIHMTGPGNLITDDDDLNALLEEYEYWGAYGSSINDKPQTFAQRQAIVQAADELDTRDPDYTFTDCLVPESGWGVKIEPDEVDEIRCDGVVEFCYEYCGFPVWGQNAKHYDISTSYYSEHNTAYGYEGYDPDTALSPVVQCGRVGGSSTYYTEPAAIDYPEIVVSQTANDGSTDVTIRASDQSGIHRLVYKWGQHGAVSNALYPQHPTQDYQEVTATTDETATLYVWASDGAGNMDGWHTYTITVNAAPGAPSGPTPSDGAVKIGLEQDLAWSCSDGDGDTLYYTVWLSRTGVAFGDEEIVKSDATGASVDPGTLEYDSTYYWMVRAGDHNGGVTGGPIWSFSTEAAPAPVLAVSPASADVSVEAGTVSFEVANAGTGTLAWTAAVVSGGDWLMIASGANGTEAGTVTASFRHNLELTPRTATIRVTASGAAESPQEVTITQASSVYKNGVDPALWSHY